MTEIGEIRRAYEIGKKSGHEGTGCYIWHACEICGKERWVQCSCNKKKPRSVICKSCAAKKRMKTMPLKEYAMKGSKNPKWNGGISIRADGYITVRLTPDEELLFSPMVGKRGYVREHRLVMAKHLNRCLEKWEIVHHKNGVKDDNRLENLELLPSEAYHCPSKMWQREIKERDDKIIDLEKQIALLKQQLMEVIK